MSGHRRPFSISSSAARDPRRFPRCPGFAAHGENRFADSNLGLGSFRAQPGFANGIRVSRKHRSGNDLVLGLCRVDVSPKSPGPCRAVFCAQLPDKDCSATFCSGVYFLLAIAGQKPQLFGSSDDHDLPVVVGTASEFSNVVCEKRARLRKLLGNLGHNLLLSTDWVPPVQPDFIF